MFLKYRAPFWRYIINETELQTAGSHFSHIGVSIDGNTSDLILNYYRIIITNLIKPSSFS